MSISVQNSVNHLNHREHGMVKILKADSTEDAGVYIGAFVNYETSENETIEVKVGISYTSIEQARLNLETEIPGWNFDEIKDAANQNDGITALSKIEVETPSAND